MNKLLTLIISLGLLSTPAGAANILKELSVAQGFEVSIFADDVENARQIAVSKKGIVYVGSRKAGKVYALIDHNSDGVADKQILVASDLSMPSGLAIKGDDLYVGEVHRIIRFKNIDKQLKAPKYEVVYDALPTERHHGWKFLRFAPTGELIIPVGVPCNICAEDERFGRIFALDVNTKQITTLAKGVRNSVGFDFHPSTQAMWFSDNGRDMMGDDIPPDELNRLTNEGEHFGFPYVHAGAILDPEFGKGKSTSDYTAPALALAAHVAPLGIHFYNGKQFPSDYKQQLFVAEHGSWNRSKKSGYKVAVATIEQGRVIKYTPFITGFMKNEETLGRPVAFAELADGSLLISDDYANVIYRVSYKKIR
ncbi:MULTISPECIES: PQQ-dependent sugar dehydrogenase [unclassified Pseudoalteromonas]|uniref:PQQ-dependent sugar dehydrogenase n=1 Tax=unclassified Pseudoalteromonas TaxID=194690 RepID=UPI0025B5EAD6|nr:MULTISPECIES: PQQ-dependent sugar dehydrogenase [unclassified Pseudoalteromonas]MDN3379214.1 PQQ-dependent sugar dehydrogenase [Pseudoalteromonas sp. APC 3893]MDN3386388.1 PQQ-dependent sugar dehydrogenase [Pseudoalteromonas sp. APC 4017]